MARFAKALPTLAVFAAIAGLFAWGHHTGWKIPSFASLSGESKSTKDDWCAEHAIRESICVECNAGLLPRAKSHGWCKEHGLHECPLCHPDVAQTSAPPTASALNAAHKHAGLALSFSDRPENDKRCGLHRRRLQFASAADAEKVGVTVEPVWTAPVEESVGGPGEVSYDPTLTARLSTRSPGTVFRAFKQIGESVRAGEIVALVDAVEVGRAKSEYLRSVAQVRLKARVLEGMKSSGGAVPGRAVTEAEAELGESRIRQATVQQSLVNLGLPIRAGEFDVLPDEALPTKLRFLGLPPAVADALDPATASGNLLPLFAPLNGLVTARDVVAGEVVDTAKVLFVVADTKQLWLTLDLRLEDARKVSPGRKVVFRPDGAEVDAVGVVASVSAEADHRTRTLKVRAAIANEDGKLAANSFGSGRVVLREEKDAIVVPAGAIHSEGCCRVVFVRDRNYLKADGYKVFHVRTIRVGATDGQHTEVVGVLPGEVVAVGGSAAMRAELLKTKLGEGCECCKK